MPRDKKPTRLQLALEEQRADFDRRTVLLQASRDAFLAIRKGETPVKIESGVDEETHREVEVIALTRANGGVVILNVYDVQYIDDWLRAVRSSFADLYLIDLANKVERHRNETVRNFVSKRFERVEREEKSDDTDGA